MDPITLIYYGMIGGFVILAVRELRILSMHRMKQRVAAIKAQSGPRDFAALSSVVANVDNILAQLYKLRDEQQAAGAGEQQLKPLNDRIKWMERIKDNRAWLEYAAPYADMIIGTGLKTIQKIVESM